MAFPWIKALAAYIAVFPGALMAPDEVLPLDLNGYEISNEAFTVPASPDGEGRYRLNLNLVPLDMPSTSIEIETEARTIIPYGEPPSAGQIALSFDSGAMEFHASDAGLDGLADYTGKGTPDAPYFRIKIAKELRAVQEFAADLAEEVVIGPATSTDKAIPTWNGTTGEALRDNPNATINSTTGVITAPTFVASNLTGAAADVAVLSTGGTLGRLGAAGQNAFLAGPVSGGPGPITLRSIETADLADIDYVAPGSITGSGLTMATNKLLGRDTVGTGAVEEIGLGTNFGISGGNLTISGLTVSQGGTGFSEVSQGDIIYADANNSLVTLTKNTSASRYLKNGGTDNNPIWSQVELSDGVTGILPQANGGLAYAVVDLDPGPRDNGDPVSANTSGFLVDSRQGYVMEVSAQEVAAAGMNILIDGDPVTTIAPGSGVDFLDVRLEAVRIATGQLFWKVRWWASDGSFGVAACPWDTPFEFDYSDTSVGVSFDGGGRVPAGAFTVTRIGNP